MMMTKALALLLIAPPLVNAAEPATIWTSMPLGDSGAAKGLGQSFTTGSLGADRKLHSIALQGAISEGNGDETAIITLRVYSSSSDDARHWMPRELVATSETRALDGVGKTTTFSFSRSEQVTLADHTVYLVAFESVGSPRIAFVGTSQDDPAEGGQAFKEVAADGSDAKQVGRDFGMSVMTVGAAPLERTSSVELAGSGLHLVLRSRADD